MADPKLLAAEMRPALVAYFRRKSGSGAEAEDLAQDVLVRALSHAQWRDAEEAKGYIFRSAVNRWADYLRRRRSHGVVLPWNEESAIAAGAGSPPERVLLAREELELVAQLLEHLPERTRTILILTKYEKLTAASIAQMLGISVSAVTKHLANAIAALAAFRAEHSKV
jgi:RNA polymerase sigma-70 factor (ECF subfamily)